MAKEGRNEFAVWLRNQRGDETITKIANEARISRSSLSRAERGVRLMRVSTLKRLCAYLGADWHKILPLVIAADYERSVKREKGEK